MSKSDMDRQLGI